jgi:hypothetical protein
LYILLHVSGPSQHIDIAIGLAIEIAIDDDNIGSLFGSVISASAYFCASCVYVTL